MKDIVEEYAIGEILSIRETLGQVDDRLEMQFGIRRFTLAKHFLTLAALEVRDITIPSEDAVRVMAPKDIPETIIEYFNGP